jgi:hypothetical protein
VAFAPYATLPEFKAWVTLTDTVDDVVLTDCLLSASQWIDGYCGTHFWQDTAVARTFVPCTNRTTVDIDDLVSITALKTDETGDGTYETTWSASDYQLQPVNRPTGHPYTNIEAVASLRFPSRTTEGSRSNRVEVTGTWGWAVVPPPVRRACLIEAAKELKRRYSPEGVAGFGEFGLIRISSRQVDPTVEAMLSDYTRTARGTGVLVA